MFEKLKKLIVGKPTRPEFLEDVWVFFESEAPTVRFDESLSPDKIKEQLTQSAHAAQRADRLMIRVVDGRPQLSIFSSQESMKPFFQKLYTEMTNAYQADIMTGFVVGSMKATALFNHVLGVEDLRVVLDPATPAEKVVLHKIWRVLGEAYVDDGEA